MRNRKYSKEEPEPQPQLRNLHYVPPARILVVPLREEIARLEVRRHRADCELADFIISHENAGAVNELVQQREYISDGPKFAELKWLMGYCRYLDRRIALYREMLQRLEADENNPHPGDLVALGADGTATNSGGGSDGNLGAGVLGFFIGLGA